MKLHIPCALALTLAFPLPAFAQNTVQKTTETTTTSTIGTIGEFGPDRITVRTETATEPLSYRMSKTVTYVDEAGAPVSIETVKSGLPVTVHYVRDGDAMVANRIVVRKRTTTVPGAQTTTTKTTSTIGTLGEFGPERITVRTEAGPEPLSYRVSKTVTYVDELGDPVSMETVKSGLLVTVHYVRDGDAMVANKIVVRKRTTTVPGAETTTTTTTSMGTISEFEPDRLVIRTTKTADPLRYKYTKTTTYVDEAGQPVSIKTVKSGIPVTVHYTKVGKDLVANRVIVRKVVTTEEVPDPDIRTEVKTISTSGTVNEFAEGRLIIRTKESTTPIIYTANGTTLTLDEAGQPVAVDMIRSGLPVTVHYTTDGDERIATKIVLTKQTTTVPRP